MITKNDILIARDKEKKALKAQAITDTKKYLKEDFTNFLNSAFVLRGEDTAVLVITLQEKYNTVFFTPKSKMNSMHPSLYDLKYFLQELKNNGFEVTEDKCYARARTGQENIIIIKI